LISIATADSLLPDFKQEQFFNTVKAKKSAAKMIRHNNARDNNAQAQIHSPFCNPGEPNATGKAKFLETKTKKSVAF
jgi:cytoplasmic iron level regulating protein YaaA (DUF328/UPF0246 family)